MEILAKIPSESEGLRRILSANIKKGRKRLGISQEKLAEMTDLSAQTINDIEGCRMWVSDKTMVKLAKALDIEVYMLLVPQAAEPTRPISRTDVLLNLQQALKDAVDRNISEAMKSL
jgi:transcriptional regulator with XRE-family HTH domain